MKLGQHVSSLVNGSVWHVSTSVAGNQVRNKTCIPSPPPPFQPHQNSLSATAPSFSHPSQQMCVVTVRNACVLMST